MLVSFVLRAICCSGGYRVEFRYGGDCQHFCIALKEMVVTFKLSASLSLPSPR